jgi:anti-anti-sigma factor
VPISLDCETCFGIKLLRVQGALGESEGLELIAQVNELLDGIGDSLVIDLGEMPAVNSAGIGAIVRIQAQANTQEQTVLFAGPTPIVRGVFQATRLDKFLRIYSTREEAIQAVRQ